MRKFFFSLTVLVATYGCKTSQTQQAQTSHSIIAQLDLVDLKDDKVYVSIDPDKLNASEAIFYIPRIVPGHYAVDDFGKFTEDFKAFDYEGNEMKFTREDDSKWVIPNAEKLDKVSYWVNDTYDIKGEGGTFSSSGTNINKGENFMLNLHGFVGYFEGLEEEDYRLEIKRPESLIPGTALKQVTSTRENSTITDIFSVNRYFEVTDNPIMYAKPDTVNIKTQGINVLLDVYSPNKMVSAEKLKPEVERMIRAQKQFLGEINNTDKYAILLYLSDMQKQDARGFGALEHHSSTVVVLPESIPEDMLKETLTDVVSHEFFHILTPLNVHSKEIHYFDYDQPVMSKHLWMYEGVTEYFANLFQVNQGLIPEQAFYDRIMGKIISSKSFDDTMSFTVMSKNILEKDYKDSFYNVYQKGALIGMALDIRLRELSNGKMGLLDLMKKLSLKYGKNMPFDDEQLFSEIIDLSYPDIGDFLNTYVSGTTPIPYEKFLEKVGLEITEEKQETGFLMKGKMPYVDVVPDTKKLYFRKNISLNTYLDELGIQGGDILISVNGSAYNLDNATNLILASQNWQKGEEITFVVERDGEYLTLSAEAFQPTEVMKKIVKKDLPNESPKVKLRQTWLKG